MNAHEFDCFQVVEVEESEELLSIPYIKQGMSELPVSKASCQQIMRDEPHWLQSWEWAYGQTPEFSYTVDNTFPWGKVVSHCTH